jgi:hypothetical protein
VRDSTLGVPGRQTPADRIQWSASRLLSSFKEMRETEKLVLRALCHGVLQGDRREQAFRILAEHRFADPQHELLFAALRTLRRADAHVIREQLPARLTALGFPDVDVTSYLDAPAPGVAETTEALRQLAGSPTKLPDGIPAP